MSGEEWSREERSGRGDTAADTSLGWRKDGAGGEPKTKKCEKTIGEIARGTLVRGVSMRMSSS